MFIKIPLEKLTWRGSFHLKIISAWINFQIIRSCFLGPVVQLTYVFQNDVIEALTSIVTFAGMKTLRWILHLHRLEPESLKHLTRNGIFAFTLLSPGFGKHLI